MNIKKRVVNLFIIWFPLMLLGFFYIFIGDISGVIPKMNIFYITMIAVLLSGLLYIFVNYTGENVDE